MIDPQRAFVYQASATRVRFGAGALAELPHELAALGSTRTLLVCTPGRSATAEHVRAALADRCAGVLSTARMHVPQALADDARRQAERLGVDSMVAIGGGSAIGLAKAVALTTGLPIIAVPTTYAGSELTSVWGLTVDGRKTTGRDQRVRPVAVVYDPDLTLDLPSATSVTSALNAIAHAAEALYAPDRNPLVSVLAVEGIRALVQAIPTIVTEPQDRTARHQAQYGAWLCATGLGATRMGLHHQLCHVLGGRLDLPHAATHAVVLPHVLAYNLPAVPDVAIRLAAALDADAVAPALWSFGRRLGAPTSLRELGMAERDIAGVADAVVASPYPNPRPLSVAGVVAVLRQAWAGDAPVAID